MVSEDVVNKATGKEGVKVRGVKEEGEKLLVKVGERRGQMACDSSSDEMEIKKANKKAM